MLQGRISLELHLQWSQEIKIHITWRSIMKLQPPKNITFYVAILLAVLGLISQLFSVVPAAAFWLVLVAFVLLALGNLVKGL